jgi:hypothetical protein
MKKIFLNIMLAFGLFLTSSCELDYLESPNNVPTSSADANFLLTNLESNVAFLFGGVDPQGNRVGLSWHGQKVTRMVAQTFNLYENDFQATSFDDNWETAYSEILIDAKNIKALADKAGFKRHSGITKTLEAYTLMSMVDFFGDIPYKETLDAGNFNPKVDNGAEVYKAAFDLLTSAKADFAGTSTGTPVDFYYANNYDRWIKLINTLQLKYHLNRRLIDKAGATTAIAALIADNKLIGNGDDFTFKYSKNASAPDSRHPSFANQFPNGGGDYQSTYYMWHMTEAKGFDDPRAKYYFYRQTGATTTSVSEQECINEFKPAHYPLEMVFCNPGTRGFWGRDHLNNDGIPPDNLKRTLWGIYPAGYRFDEGKFTPAGAADLGNGGAGIQPILMASYVDFMLAEAALTLGTAGSVKDLVLSGVGKSISFVRSWSLTTSEAAKINAVETATAATGNLTKYTDYIGKEIDAAATDKDKLRIVAREYWLALFGNGVESYNLYRRTGMPDGMQPGLNPQVGKFPRSMNYPSAYVNRNSNAKQKTDMGLKVFWDNNADGFIN